MSQITCIAPSIDSLSKVCLSILSDEKHCQYHKDLNVKLTKQYKKISNKLGNVLFIKINEIKKNNFNEQIEELIKKYSLLKKCYEIREECRISCYLPEYWDTGHSIQFKLLDQKANECFNRLSEFFRIIETFNKNIEYQNQLNQLNSLKQEREELIIKQQLKKEQAEFKVQQNNEHQKKKEEDKVMKIAESELTFKALEIVSNNNSKLFQDSWDKLYKIFPKYLSVGSFPMEIHSFLKLLMILHNNIISIGHNEESYKQALNKAGEFVSEEEFINTLGLCKFLHVCSLIHHKNSKNDMNEYKILIDKFNSLLLKKFEKDLSLKRKDISCLTEILLSALNNKNDINNKNNDVLIQIKQNISKLEFIMEAIILIPFYPKLNKVQISNVLELTPLIKEGIEIGTVSAQVYDDFKEFNKVCNDWKVDKNTGTFSCSELETKMFLPTHKIQDENVYFLKKKAPKILKPLFKGQPAVCISKDIDILISNGKIIVFTAGILMACIDNLNLFKEIYNVLESQ